MVYTVRKMSELSGVTVRTLHFYEEAGLLKPAYYGSNGYRYYEEKELLELQQILFFKELGFSLKQIQKVLGRSDFDPLTALHSHRKALGHELQKIEKLIETIDKTIKHLKDEKKMKHNREFFVGFSQIKAAQGGESYFSSEKIVLENLKSSDWKQDKVAQIGNELYSKMADCLEKGRDPNSAEVQDLVRKHHAFTENFHIASKEVYKALSELYRDHPEFRKQLDPIHPGFADFLTKAMDLFADRELS